MPSFGPVSSLPVSDSGVSGTSAFSITSTKHLHKVDPVALVGATNTITVSSADIDANLTDFPVYVDLSNMPTSFWTNVSSDGSNIRISNSGGTRLPVDVLWVDTDREQGHLFFLADSLSSSSDTAFTVDFAGGGEAAYDRDNVWADYESVVTFSDWPNAIINRVNGVDVTVSSGVTHTFYRVEQFDTGVGFIDGVAWDGTHYYVTGSFNGIKKYDESYTLVDENTDPEGDASTEIGGGVTVDDMGGCCEVSGKLWCCMTASGGPTRYLVAFDTSDLTYLEHFEITSTCDNNADVAERSGNLFVCEFSGGQDVQEYNPATGSHVQEITLSSSQPNGITFAEGYMWIAYGSAGGGFLLDQYELDGTRLGVAGSTGSTGQEAQGIDYDTVANEFVWAIDAGGSVGYITHYRETDIALGAGGGHRLRQWDMDADFANGSGALGTSWLSGLTFIRRDGTLDSLMTAGVLHRIWTSGLEVTDGSNGALTAGLNPSEDVAYRVNVYYDGTTERAIYHTGANKQTDSTITAQGSGQSTLSIGNNSLNGVVAFAYARPSIPSNVDAWVAAEYAMLNNNATFLSNKGVRPDTPKVTITAVSGTGVSAETSAFSAGEGGAHEGTDWRITRVSDGVVVYNPGLDTTNKTSIVNAGSTVPLDTANESYTLEARHGEQE